VEGGRAAARGRSRLTSAVAERIAWAVRMLDVQPTDRLLEIGGGAGIAVSLVCEALTTGSITGVDRSVSAIEQSARRNRAHVESGKATVVAAALEDAGSIPGRFDKAFAINVRLFRGDAAAREAEILRRLLAPGGRLYLIQQHPSAERTRAVTAELEGALAGNGFRIVDRRTTGRGDALMTCLVAGLD
jgi:cyclopropane fatty-acyl-phospholipid synthase-like methyltransferase